MDESTHDRDPLDLLAEEFSRRCRQGTPPSIDEFIERAPALADEIRELFPTIAALERAKSATSPSGVVQGQVQLERLGDFRLVRELGRGGMGIVYEAEQESLGRRVAIKVLPGQRLLESRQVERFEREARTAAKLHHTNIVPVFGVGESDGYRYIVMQYIPGVGLDGVFRALQRLRLGTGDAAARASGVSGLDVLGAAREAMDASASSDASATVPLDRSLSSVDTIQTVSGSIGRPRRDAGYWRSIAGLTLQAAEALAYAHEQGTVHRDIKPANLLLDAGGTLWIADFGLARATDHDGVTQPGDVVGTLRYMAPEQFRGRGDARSDIYSLGLTLYEFAALEPAFTASARTNLIGAIMDGRVTAPRKQRPDLPRDLETIILKSIAREPEHRYQNAGALAADLRRYLEDRPILARRASLTERLFRWRRRNPALAGAVVVAAVLLLTVSVVSTVAYVQTSRANRATELALSGEREQRARTEATTDLALEALDTIFNELAPRQGGWLTSTGEDSNADTVSVPLQPVLSPQTAALLEHMLEFYQRLADQEGEDDPGMQRKIADANRRIGDLHLQLGHLDDSQIAYARALTSLNSAPTDRGLTEDVVVEQAEILLGIGKSYVAQDRPIEARDAFAESRKVLERFAAENDPSPRATFTLAQALYLLGQRHRPPVPPDEPGHPGFDQPPHGGPRFIPPADRHEGPRPAVPPPHVLGLELESNHLDRAVDLLINLTETYAAVPEYRHLLALCFRERYRPRNRIAGDPDEVTRAIDLLETLAREYPNVPQYRFDLSQTYALRTAREPGLSATQIAEVRAGLRQAVVLGEALVTEHPNVPAYALALAETHHKLADANLRAAAPEDAERSLHRAIDLQSDLADRFPDILPYQVATALFRTSLARLLIETDRQAEAQLLLESVLDRLQVLEAGGPQPAYVEDLAERCRRILTRARQAPE